MWAGQLIRGGPVCPAHLCSFFRHQRAAMHAHGELAVQWLYSTYCRADASNLLSVGNVGRKAVLVLRLRSTVLSGY